MLSMANVISIGLHSAVKDAVAHVLKGSVIAVPTDTLYGLACSAFCDEAISRLYAVKQRSAASPLAICVADISDIYKWCHVSVSRELLESLLPGPVTVVFERSVHLNKRLNPDCRKIAVRIPDHDFVRSIVRNTNVPLALTSANISAEQSCLSVNEFSHLWSQIDAVFDGGPLHDKDPERLGSTVVDFSVEGKCLIGRKGCALPLVTKILSEFKVNISVPT